MLKFQNRNRPKHVLYYGPAVLTATPTGVSFDSQDFSCVEFSMITGIGGITFTTTNKIEWIMKHGSVTSPAAQTAVEATDIVLGGSLTLATGGIIWALTAAHAAAATNLVEYIGGERYVSIVPTFGGTHATGTPVALLARGSHARLNPPA